MIMQRLTRRPTQPIFRRPRPPTRNFSRAGILLDSNVKPEEEKLKGYLPERFYPVKIAEVFRSRYQVVGNLGYGGHSTAWLCRDLQKHAYVALKIYEHDSDHGRRDKEVYKYLKNVKSGHTGSILVRRAIDDFEISSADNSYTYQCLVYPPLAMSLHGLHSRAIKKVLPEYLLKPALIHILLALHFLHTEAKIVHADIQENNIMRGVDDELILVDFEEAERSSPSHRRIVGDRVIYTSRGLGIPKVHGRPVLSDFGDARFSSSLGKQWEDVQPLVYRAPEVLFRIPWSEKIDIWNLGCLAWDLFEQRRLFYARDSNGNVSDRHHLAGMIAIMGVPPQELLRNSEYAMKFFDHDDNWIGAAEIPSTSLEKLGNNLRDTQQSLFLRFMRKRLQ